MKVSIFFSTTDRALEVLCELFMKPTLPLWSKSFYKDICTPLRHDHDIPEGQSSCFYSFSLFSLALLCNYILLYDCLCFLYNSALLITQRNMSVCVLNAEKQTSLLFSFYEAEQFKNMYAPCVDVTLHPISISAGELQHLPCMQPSYIHNSRSHSLSI